MKKLNNKGITLIALVITIIVLLILASVSLNMILGNNGIIKKTQLVKEKTNIDNVQEEITIAILEEQTNSTSTNSNFDYSKVWDNLRKKDAYMYVEGPKDSKYDIFYKKYQFQIDENKKVIYVGEKQDNSHTGNNMEELGTSATIDGITYSNIYEIWNKAQLENFRNRVNSGEKFEDCLIIQKVDINLNNENWEPIGYGTTANDLDKYFSGRYNGENHVILGLSINNNNKYQALFGDTWSDSDTKKVIIENLTVEGNVKGGHVVAGLIARAGNTKIINCKNKVNVNSTLYENIDNAYVSSTGGIVGRTISNSDVEIINCENYGNIKSEYGTIGGIAGLFQQGRIFECKNYQLIECNVNRVGGIVGCITKGDIEKCYNTKTIKGAYYIGGIAGVVGQIVNKIEAVSIKKCNNTGQIHGEGYIGGILGWIRKNSTIDECSNVGDIFSTSHEDYWSYTGGILGYSGDNSKISNCYNTGNIEVNYRGVGGIAGGLSGATDGNSYIKNCYNIGNITNTNLDYYGRTGGIWGLLRNKINDVNNCWQLQNCVKKGEDTDQTTNVENKTEDEIRHLDWEKYILVQGKNKGYPILIWEN